jgi:hypothetical protein
LDKCYSKVNNRYILITFTSDSSFAIVVGCHACLLTVCTLLVCYVWTLNLLILLPDVLIVKCSTCSQLFAAGVQCVIYTVFSIVWYVSELFWVSAFVCSKLVGCTPLTIILRRKLWTIIINKEVYFSRNII